MTRRSPGPPSGANYEVGYGRPPAASQFVKGRSGNARGRPKARSVIASPFDVMMDQTLTIERNGVTCEVTPEEALQHALLKKALAGSRPAIRKVLKMIHARQEALATSAPSGSGVELLFEYDNPDNANDALLILGAAATEMVGGEPRLKLLTWAVQAALDRRGAPPLGSEERKLITARAIGPEKIVWRHAP